MKRTIFTIGLLSTLVFGAASALANEFTTSTVAVGGYDAITYHTEGKPIRGNGDHVAIFEGETYLFSSDRNKRRFEANPKIYAPGFGGYCAYGVAVGKKFIGDPEIWKVVDGTLYLNLNADIQKTWKKDIPGNIVKADSNWPRIKDKAPSEL